MRKKVFCWLPTCVYKVRFWRDGFIWLGFGWLDKDGCIYRDKNPLEIDFDDLHRMK